MKKFFSILFSVLMTLCVCMAITAEQGLDFTATPNASDEVKEVKSNEELSKAPTTMYFDTKVEGASAEQTQVITDIKNGKVTPVVEAETKTDASGANYVNFDVKPVYVDSKEEVNTEGNAVTFSLNVGEVFKPGTRVYVEHYHGDEIEYSIHDVTNEGLIWVTTSKGFSTFIVGAFESSNVTPTPTPTPTPTTAPVEEKKEETSTSTTSTSTVVTCEQAMGSKDWTWSEAKKACVYKVTNTSAE